MDKYLFDDFDSLLHFVLGALLPFLPLLISVPALLFFITYEVLEPENPVSTVGDVVEMLCGFALGVLLRLGGIHI